MYESTNQIIDIQIFRHDYLRHPDNSYMGINFKQITLPSAQDFNIAQYTFSGYPQVSLASKEVFGFEFIF